MIIPGKFDIDTFALARQHLNSFIHRMASTYVTGSGRLLEIGPQERSEIKIAFSNYNTETLDIVSDYNPDIIGDITKYNQHIHDSSYDVITCLEVLEHTVNPFAAIHELRRIAKDGSYLLFSAPLNWRIHGPIPDCWRFTEFGWRILLKDFDIIEIDKLETPDRPLFPIKYNILARCNKSKNIDIHTIKFEPIK
jgi:hypothetical protein